MNHRLPQLARLISVASLVALAVPAFAAAQSSRDKVRIRYTAPSNCPTQADFEARVSSRVSAPWLAPDGELARPLRITVESSQGAWQASLRLEDQGGQVLSRSVIANNCEASVEAIALVTALLLESSSTPSNASAAAPGEAVPAPGVQPLSAAVPSQGLQAPNNAAAFYGGAVSQTPVVPASRQAQPQTRAAPALPLYRVTTDQVPAPPSNRPDRRLPELGSSFGVLTGLGSGVAYGATVFGGFSTASTLSRMGFVAYQTGFAATDVAGVHLRGRLLAVKLEHCPLVLPIVRGLRVFACVGVETGILLTNGRAEAGINVDAKAGHALWLMVGLTPKLSYHWKRVFAELEPELFAPVTRRKFEVTPAAGVPAGGSELAHQTPILAFGGLLSLGLQFE